MTSFQKLQRRIGGFPIEYPAAALMALAVAFATFALPDWRFEAAVNASGLPGIVSAAQPPLGLTARLLAALALGALSFAAVWFALRALDAKPQATDFPAFRAADLHPDAPRRRPILAGAEFGAPADDLPSIEEQLGRRRPVIVAEPLPSFLSPDVSQPKGFEEIKPRIEEDDLSDADADATWPFSDAPVRSEPVAPAPVNAPVPAPVPATSPVPTREPILARKPAGTEAPVVPAPSEPVVADPVVRRAPIFAPEPVVVPASAAQPVLAAAPQVVSDADEEESVTELMARLESGLSEHGARPLPGPSASAQEELRRALGDLNRVSGRG